MLNDVTALHVRPQGLSGAATRLWRYGDGTGPATTDEPPVPGDLWLIAEPDPDFGEAETALVLVTHVTVGANDSGYVLAVPATPVESPAWGPALRLDHSILDVPLVVWTNLGRDIAFDALTRRLGTTVEAFTLEKIRSHMHRRGPAPLPEVETPYDEDLHRPYGLALAEAMRHCALLDIGA